MARNDQVPRRTHPAPTPLRMAVVAAVLLALLAVASAQPNPGPALGAPVEGAACGPDANNAMNFTWIRIPSSKLTAMNGAGVVAGNGDGCVTSDSGARAYVAAELPWGEYIISAVSLRASAASASGRNLTILAGNANVSAFVNDYRGGADVLKGFSRCRALRAFAPSAAGGRQGVKCDSEASGSWVVVLAQELTVCDMLVCATQRQFSENGTPLTRAASQLSLAVTGSDSSAGNGSLSQAGQSSGRKLLDNWPTGGYGTCPDGSTPQPGYFPGESVCNCFSCSSWTGRRYCEQGDATSRNDEMCCAGFCPPQPHCAYCRPACTPTFVSIDAVVDELPTDPAPQSLTTLSYAYTASALAVNLGSNAQTITTTFSVQQQLTATMTFATAFQFSEKVVLKIGIPFIRGGGVGLEFGAQQTFTTTTTNTDQRTVQWTTALTEMIPPLTAQQVNASASAVSILTRVPITVTTRYTCAQPNTVMKTFANIITSGTVATTAAQLQVVYGPQFPLDAPLVYPQADASCASNPICSDLGFRTGNCCPNANGVYDPCCSFCAAKPACAKFAVDNSTMCCPSATNYWNSCCGTRPV